MKCHLSTNQRIKSLVLKICWTVKQNTKEGVVMVEVINNYPNIMKYWDAEKNLKWDSNSISVKSRSKFFWICPDCSHHWQSLISTTYRLSKIYDKFCPCCNLGQELVPEKNSILAAFPSIINYIDFHIEDVETIKEK